MHVDLEPGEIVGLDRPRDAAEPFGPLAEIQVDHQSGLRANALAEGGEHVLHRGDESAIDIAVEQTRPEVEAAIEHARLGPIEKERVGLDSGKAALDRFSAEPRQIIERSDARLAELFFEEFAVAYAEAATVRPIELDALACRPAEK